MIEKVNPAHPDKVADRIAGAIVDLAYTKQENPKIAVEVLIGHGTCTIVIESSVDITRGEVAAIVCRIAGTACSIFLNRVQQDVHLADNQQNGVRCGDNGIFRGVPLTDEQITISKIARRIYAEFESDGKYILTPDKLTICQSNAKMVDVLSTLDEEWVYGVKETIINPLGYWTGGPDVDTGATNRKLGSDMADSVTGGGIHGKDLSKADVSVNIYAFAKAQATGEKVEMTCSIGDETVDGIPYEDIVSFAREYINKLGGFEKLAEWGLF